MSTVTCGKCGGQTNTAVCDWDIPTGKIMVVSSCYAKWDGEKWVKGCGYHLLDPTWDRPFVDKLLLNKPNHDDKAMLAEGCDEDEEG